MAFRAVILCLVLLVVVTLADKPIICYDSMNIPRQKVNPFLCTHFLLFAGSFQNFTFTYPSLQIISDTVALKKINPSLKVMLSLTSFGSDGDLRNITVNDTLIDVLGNQLLAFLVKYNLDGLDIDWEWPILDYKNGTYTNMGPYFNVFLATLQKKFSVAPRPLLLSAAVAAFHFEIDNGYILPEMANYLDFINLMTYDFHNYAEGYTITGYNSPIYPPKDWESKGQIHENHTEDQRSWDWTINYWIEEKGVPREKLMIGVPFYAHSWSLNSTINNTIFSPAYATGPHNYEGWLWLCNQLKANNYIRVWDNYSLVPYMYKDDIWISYDDPQSIYLKGRWICDNNLAGAMIYNLDNEDPDGSCLPGSTWPLLNALKASLSCDEHITSTKTTTEKKTTTAVEGHMTVWNVVPNVIMPLAGLLMVL